MELTLKGNGWRIGGINMVMELPYAEQIIYDAEVYKMKLMEAGLLNIRNFDKIMVSPEVYQKIMESRMAREGAPIEPVVMIRGYRFLVDRNCKGVSYLMEDVS